MLVSNTILQNRYRIAHPLGQGGMGTVYQAVDERLDTIVALKECHFTDEQLRKQFEREARLLARLRHPAITRVIDHFQQDDGQFLVMDFIPGDDLSELLRISGAIATQDVMIWADQLLDALEYLHSQTPPVIHRDIKPQNLKLTARNQIILLDFGLAKGFAGQFSRVTTSGSIFGYTPNYAPLEQIQGTGTDPRSDIYSLAASLYHLVTGTVPPDVLTRLTATTDGDLDPLVPAHNANKKVNPTISAVLNQAMAIGRNQRYTSATEMRRALRELAERNHEPKHELPPTIKVPSTVKKSPRKQQTHPKVQSTITVPRPENLADEVRANLPPRVAVPSFSAMLDEVPSTTLFEAPMETIDRFSITRKLGIFVLLLVAALIVIGLIGSIIGQR
jgi:serine/threonine protein kinase